MILNARNDLFKIELPKVFIPEDIKKRYSPYLFRMNSLFANVTDLTNYSIQKITMPNMNYSPVTQTMAGYEDTKRGNIRDWRAATSIENLMDRTFTITFQLLDGYVNYWILYETFLHYYAYPNPQPFAYDIPIRILDAEGNLMYSQIYHDCLLTGISQLTLSYSDISPEFKEFDCTFRFNQMFLKFENG